ncbi:nucleoside phosphorylase [Gardnerella sp. DNF00502]|uniref:nucleoside phosphorylase n=1 Tax=unclassified Gardnerella TaxID=2628112 RepID=UPI000C9F8F6F|nr:nucleoside phosphorylase [Gardnerella sp. KA00735]PNP89989.1 phosphorylase [Gardnerella sp. KA00735]
MTEYDLPILEYDSDKSAVLMPSHDNIAVRLPSKAVFAFLGDEIDKYALSRKATIVANFESATKVYPIYVLEEKVKKRVGERVGERVGDKADENADGKANEKVRQNVGEKTSREVVEEVTQKICLVQAPVGAPAAVQILDWLISYGVREVVSAGSCGSLVDYAENVFLVPYKALRDEGTSYHYLPPSRYVDVSDRSRHAILQTLQAHNLPYHEVKTWTTDGFFRETKMKVASRKQDGCAVVEMECSALAACAQMRGIVWGEILYTADTLHDVENYDERNWGGDSKAYALELCIESVLRI